MENSSNMIDSKILKDNIKKDNIKWKVYDRSGAKPNNHNVCFKAIAFTHCSFENEGKLAIICFIMPNNVFQIDDPFLKDCTKQYKISSEALSCPDSEYLKALSIRKSYLYLALGRMSFPVATRFFSSLVKEGLLTQEEASNFIRNKDYTYEKVPQKENEFIFNMALYFSETTPNMFKKNFDDELKIATDLHRARIAENTKQKRMKRRKEQGLPELGLDDADAALKLGERLTCIGAFEYAVKAYQIIDNNSLFYAEAIAAIENIRKEQALRAAELKHIQTLEASASKPETPKPK